MSTDLNEVEALLRARFSKEEADKKRIPSTATPDARTTRVDQLALPEEERARMPLTKSKFIARDNPQLVQWERETRRFLRRLSPEHEHRVAAVMVYEWVTGIKLADLYAAGGNANADLRMITKLLRHYFGEKSYMTWIAGRKVPRCFKVRSGYYIRRHRPLTLTLWAEYGEGVLNP